MRGGIFIELMMRHRIEMCGADARRAIFRAPTSGARPYIKRFFAYVQNDTVGETASECQTGKSTLKIMRWTDFKNK